MFLDQVVFLQPIHGTPFILEKEEVLQTSRKFPLGREAQQWL